ncbi:hypothetical protein ACMFMG_003102 [Clarireedia jacksonii]
MTTGSGKTWKYSYKSLAKLNFPVDVLDEEMLSPVPGFMKMAESPVFGAQANFIDGGLILFTTVIHTASDVIAHYNQLCVWASKSRAKWESTDSGNTGISVSQDMLDRGPLMHGNAEVQKNEVREFKLHSVNAGMTEASQAALIDGNGGTVADIQLGIFSISKSKLDALCRLVSGSGRSGDAESGAANGHKTWITVNNALASFFWTHVNLARFSRAPEGLSDVELRGNLSMAIDGRLRLDPPLPVEFMGNAALGFPITLPLHPPDSSMAELAESINSAMADFNTKHLRDVIGWLERTDNLSEERMQYTQTLNPTLVISNLKDVPYPELDWGAGLGFLDKARPLKPFKDRIPRAIPSVQYRNGDVEVIIWIEKTAMARLMLDSEWDQFWTLEVLSETHLA